MVTADRPMEGLGEDEMVRLMVGREAGALFPPRPEAAAGPSLLSLRNFTTGRARGIDLDARGGEILGLGGLVGQGQEDFLLGLFGALPASADAARIGTARRPLRSVSEALAAGLAYVPADRKEEGLVLPHSIAANLILPTLGRWPTAAGGAGRPNGPACARCRIG